MLEQTKIQTDRNLKKIYLVQPATDDVVQLLSWNYPSFPSKLNFQHNIFFNKTQTQTHLAASSLGKAFTKITFSSKCIFLINPQCHPSIPTRRFRDSYCIIDRHQRLQYICSNSLIPWGSHLVPEPLELNSKWKFMYEMMMGQFNLLICHWGSNKAQPNKWVIWNAYCFRALTDIYHKSETISPSISKFLILGLL